ncbi:unnamed protein product [Allacma fusca]|uniref:Uncharacterized protein n=1 Tax=Allacma fusca TaxID=39272 RepID=A0A8J2LSH0_9HEXA|nr:unnamed protein product [Allacma fusca]
MSASASVTRTEPIQEEQGAGERKYSRNKETQNVKHANVTYYAMSPNREIMYYQPVYVYSDPLTYPGVVSPYCDYEPVILDTPEEARRCRKTWIWCIVIFLVFIFLITILSIIAIYATPHDYMYRTERYRYYYTHCNFFSCHRHYY